MEVYEVESRVAAGAAWMDEKVPGWENQISLLQLNINSPFSCVLGQTFGHRAELHTNGYYWALINELGGNAGLAIELGFNALEAEYEERLAEMPVLTEAWRRLIAKRVELALAA